MAASAPSGTTLARLLDLLGATTVTCTTAPCGTDVTVLAPRLYDPADPAGIAAGDVVLGVNVDAGSPEAAVAVTECGLGRAAAIAIKGDVATLAHVAQSKQVALLEVADDVSWDQLYALIRNAANIAAGGSDDEQAPLGDLFALANTLAAAIGAAVTIEDADSTLLAYSNLDQPIDEARRDTILGRRTPGKWVAVLEEEGVPRQLLAAPPGTAVRVHDPHEQARDRLVIAVRAGAEILGTVWAVEGDQPLDDRAKTLLEETAPLAALHLLRHRATDDLDRAERARLLHALLDGQRTAAEVATGIGVDVGEACAVVNFQLTGTDAVDLALRRSRALDLIVLACEALRRRVVCAGVGPSVYALFPSVTDVDAFVADVAARVSDGLGVRVVAGIGSTVPRLSAVTTSRQDADRAVRVLTLDEKDERLAARIDDVRVESILLEIGDLLASRPDLSLPALDALAESDREKSKASLATLQAMAEASWDIAAAARRLNLHPNSLRYRLQRLEHTTGLTLDDPAHRLVISLQLLTNRRRTGEFS